MPNRLSKSTSPYLRQHENNPIDWYEWSEEAFAKAKAEDKPIFLSIGYSSCHWCHVMAHETFEDPKVAAFLNEHFVSIKVDREERPDVDEAYMTAVQMISGRGGWPMTLFLTPDKKPFFGGTYFPPQDRGQYPGFTSLVTNILKLWKQSRNDVLSSANQVAAALEKALGRTMSSATSTIQPQLFADCFNALRSDFDGEHGGFGKAPKFPGHTSLAFLMEYPMLNPEAASECFSMVFMTLEQMALGGIHDQVGGGFHRYSTDAEWLLPHFEKMLVDNALLLSAYLRAAHIANEIGAPVGELFEQSAIGILEWVKREMTTPEGTFCSAMDADSEGEEGLFYLWSVEEIRTLLGPSADRFIEAFGLEEAGNYQDEATKQRTGLNILHLKENYRGAFRTELQILLEARAARVMPLVDHKALAAWNGMMIRALIEAEEMLMAERAIRVWMAHTSAFGSLPHQITAGVPSGLAFLDDYAHMVLAAVEMFSVTENPEYRRFAEELLGTMVAKFSDDDKGGFFYTSEDHEELFGRSKPSLDQSMPSPNAAAIEACLSMGQMEVAEKALMSVLGWAQKIPNATEALIRCAMTMTMLAQVRGDSAEGPSSIAPVMSPAQAPAPVGKVTVKLAEKEIQSSGGKATGRVLISIPEGLHLNTNNPPARWLVATELSFEGIRAAVTYPSGANDRYEGDFEIPFEATVSEPTEFELRVKFQACTETECLAPEEVVLDGVLLP